MKQASLSLVEVCNDVGCFNGDEEREGNRTCVAAANALVSEPDLCRKAPCQSVRTVGGESRTVHTSF